MLYTCSVLVRQIVSKFLEVRDLNESRLLYSLALAIFLCHKCWWIRQYTSISMIIYLQPDIFFLEPHGIPFPKSWIFPFQVFFKICYSKCEHPTSISILWWVVRNGEFWSPHQANCIRVGFFKTIYTILMHIEIWEVLH